MANHSTNESHAPEEMPRKTESSVRFCLMQATSGIQAQKRGPTSKKQWLPAQVGRSVSGNSHLVGNEGTLPVSTGHVSLTSEIEVLACLVA